MSSMIIKMRGNHEKSINEVAAVLRSRIPGLFGELVTENWRHFDNCKVVLLVFEKLYLRNDNYANLTVLLTETKEEQTADIVGSGGGAGMFNWSWGANSHFAKTAVNILAENGFRE